MLLQWSTGGKVLFSAPDCRLGWPWSSSDVHMLLLSAFFAIFGCFAVAMKWLTERSGRQWSTWWACTDFGQQSAGWNLWNCTLRSCSYKSCLCYMK